MDLHSNLNNIMCILKIAKSLRGYFCVHDVTWVTWCRRLTFGKWKRRIWGCGVRKKKKWCHSTSGADEQLEATLVWINVAHPNLQPDWLRSICIVGNVVSRKGKKNVWNKTDDISGSAALTLIFFFFCPLGVRLYPSCLLSLSSFISEASTQSFSLFCIFVTVLTLNRTLKSYTLSSW